MICTVPFCSVEQTCEVFSQSDPVLSSTKGALPAFYSGRLTCIPASTSCGTDRISKQRSATSEVANQTRSVGNTKIKNQLMCEQVIIMRRDTYDEEQEKNQQFSQLEELIFGPIFSFEIPQTLFCLPIIIILI